MTFTPAVPKFLQGMLQPKKKEPVKLAMPDVDDDEGDDLPTVGPALDPRLCCAVLCLTPTLSVAGVETVRLRTITQRSLRCETLSSGKLRKWRNAKRRRTVAASGDSARSGGFTRDDCPC